MGVDVGDKDFGHGYVEFVCELFEFGVSKLINPESGEGLVWVSSVRHGCMIWCYNTKVKKKFEKSKKSLKVRLRVGAGGGRMGI